MKKTKIDKMVDRFLGWKLPRDFAPDGGIIFNLVNQGDLPLPECWPIGTNLFTADQARVMIEYMLAEPDSAIYSAPNP